MNSKIKNILIALLIVCAGAFFAWSYVFKPNTDLSNNVPEKSFSFDELINKSNSDTSSLSKMIDRFIAVKGIIKSISKDKASITIELGDSMSMSSIVCQIDNRHQANVMHFKEGEIISLKGKITGFTIDTELGLGNTIQMNFCSLNN